MSALPVSRSRTSAAEGPRCFLSGSSRRGRFPLIDESYNANPASMAATLKSLGAERDIERRIGPKDRDAPFDVTFGAEAFQRRGHGRGIGVIALVDQQEIAPVEMNLMALTAALQAAEVRERETGNADIEAERFDHSEYCRAHSRPNGRRVAKW